MNSTVNKILVLLAHPSLHHSKINKKLRDTIMHVEGVTVHDLYNAYPEFYINVKQEQQLLQQHQLIIFQHPLYWYNLTPMLKLWQDVVLSQGFAYGDEGTALQGKDFLSVISTGGKDKAYQHDGYNRFTINDLMAPQQATCNMCGINYHDPLVLHHSFDVSNQEIENHATKYKTLLENYVNTGSFSATKEK